MLEAKENMVLCDGSSMTSIGGAVYLPEGADPSVWVNMTEAEALALLFPEEDDNSPATEEDLYEALARLGVSADD